jgi:hypothetical protein
MKIKFLSVLVLLAFFSCKKQQENSELTVVKKVESQLIKEKDVTKLQYTDYLLDARADVIIENWVEYSQLQDVVNKVKKADLSFFNNNSKTIKELLKNLKETIPAEVNTPSILARITALETKIYKLESLSKLTTTTKPELLELTKEFLIAFSNLNLQMNKKLEGDSIIIEKP